MVGQVGHQGSDAVPDLVEPLAVQDPAQRVVGRQPQPLDGDLVVIGCQRAFLEQQLGLPQRLVRVVGQHALVEILDRREGGTVAEQDVEEFQPVDMAPEHDEAQRQRRRQHEPRWAPRSRSRRSPRSPRQRVTGRSSGRRSAARGSARSAPRRPRRARPSRPRPTSPDRPRPRPRRAGSRRSPDRCRARSAAARRARPTARATGPR